MRVFCPEHKRGFFAPRQSPIKCENRGHVLGELDFSGEANRDFQLQWQYCCNCAHFSLIDFAERHPQQCPVCARRRSTIYLCDRCQTVSFESDTPLHTKNFTLTSEGLPQPCCAGCLQSPTADLREHNCDDFRATIVTALNVCPVCNERLDIAPSFPSLVADYLRKTKSANKLLVTFDYESELFVPVDDGEFVIVTNSDENGRAVVLPRSPQLTSRRDFYEVYQDYYQCANPDAGEVSITEPAIVVPMSEGWKLLATGVLEVVNKQPDTKAPVSARPAPPIQSEMKAPVSARPAPPIQSEMKAPVTTRPAPPIQPERKAPVTSRLAPPIQPEEPIVRSSQVRVDESDISTEPASPCTRCGAIIESKYAYCWECGNPREPILKASMVRPKIPRLIVSTEESDDEERTMQHHPTSAKAQLFAWASTQKPDAPARSKRSVLKLFSIAASGLLIGLVALFALTRSSERLTSVTSAQTTDVATNATQADNPASAPRVETQPAQQAPGPVLSKEDELESLRRMRAFAKPTDRSRILQTFARTEKKYSDDYRIPYERAKLVVMDHEKNFHGEAFVALARAAQKAISKGKAGEMLQSLNDDSDGAFQKLSHGHREWTQLQRALKRNDVSALPANEGL